MTADDLIAVAEDLLRPAPGQSKQATLKRSISTAYYAVFHAVAHECVGQLVGWGSRSANYWKIVTPVYRSFDHATAKRIFLQVSNDRSRSAELRQLGVTFVSLQDDRRTADYDPQPRFSRRYATERVKQAAAAIEALRGLSSDERRLLAVQLVTKQR